MRKGKIISIFFFNLFKLEIHLKYLHAMQQGHVALHVAFTELDPSNILKNHAMCCKTAVNCIYSKTIFNSYILI